MSVAGIGRTVRAVLDDLGCLVLALALVIVISGPMVCGYVCRWCASRTAYAQSCEYQCDDMQQRCLIYCNGAESVAECCRSCVAAFHECRDGCAKENSIDDVSAP